LGSGGRPRRAARRARLRARILNYRARMKKPKDARGLSDQQLLALIESLPEGIALVDGNGRAKWANRRARELLALRATTSPADDVGTELGALVGRLVEAMPPFRSEERVRWSVTAGGSVDVALRRMWASQSALWLSPSAEVPHLEAGDATPAPTTLQLIVAERMLEDATVGLIVANGSGAIEWMNPQARRLLGSATKRVGRDAKRDVARAARHVANGKLVASVRARLELPMRAVEARFWNVAPGLAGVLFDGEAEEARSSFRLIA
jgi:PAS domain-containing protein